MTKQEYFELLVRSARDGTFPSMDRDDMECRYRGDGTAACKQRCAIGVLIEDEDYRPEFDTNPPVNGTISYMTRQVVDEAVEIPDGVDFNFLSYVQEIHDNWASNPKWDADGFIKELTECFTAKEEPEDHDEA